MADPGWRGMWRYALPLPDFVVRRLPSLHAPSQFHLLRGVALGTPWIGAWGVLTAVFVYRYGRVEIGDPGSGQLLFWLGFVVLAVALAREMRKGTFEASDPTTAVVVVWQHCGVPQLVGVVVMSIAVLVAWLTGWWPIALLGPVAIGIGLAYGSPTKSRIRRIEAGLRAHGYEGDLVEQLLIAPVNPD